MGERREKEGRKRSLLSRGSRERMRERWVRRGKGGEKEGGR